MNVFSNIALNTEVTETVKVKSGEKQNCVELGDILFTGSSETPDECGMSSVLTKQPPEKLYLNSFCFGFRLHDANLLLPDFSKYLFRSNSLRKQIEKTASGVTRFNVSKQKMLKVRVPIPPLSVQEEIVRILDSFTELEAELETELETELEARKKQYEYYREQILSSDAPRKPFIEVCDYVDYRGKTPKKVDRGIQLITAKNIRKGYIDYETSKEYIAEDDFNEVMHRGKVKLGDVLITTEAPCGNVAQIDKEEVALAQRVIKYRGKIGVLNNDYLRFILQAKDFQSQLQKHATGGTVKGIKGSVLHLLEIPVPTLDEQRQKALSLEIFESYINDIVKGLPAEIEARRKQYEYYRDKLLTFKELEA